MNYIISIIFLALSFFIINRTKMFRSRAIPKLWINIAYIVKLIAAVTMLFIYSRSETIKRDADIFRFYDDAQVIFSALEDGNISIYTKLLTGKNANDKELQRYYIQINNFEFGESNSLSSNRFIIRYIAFLSIFTLGTYGGIMIFTVFLSFTGLWWIFLFFYSKMKRLKWFIFGIIFFTPSIVYWTSGILKESLILFAISLLINCGNYALQGKHPFKRAIIVLLSLLVIYSIKPFVLFVIIPPLLAYLWIHFRPSQRTFVPYFMLAFIAFSFASESDKYMDISIFNSLLDKQLQLTELAINDNSGSIISPIMFEANSISIASNSPIAIINTLFRPMMWEANNLLAIFASVENMFILLFIILLIIYPRMDVDDSNVLWFSLVFSIIYFIIIGLGTPVLGALSRYRVPGLLFFLLTIIQLLDIDKIKAKIL
ncbi:MAG: hypothetical protein B6I18_00140 [Bacteroidetes bacterium 4572_112]|nr:MAG: hypothetical protein B6I18_00140 [Bacteroidetes bacterium 4572_112]